MPFPLKRLGAASLAGALLLAGGQAFAQSQRKPAAPAQAPAPQAAPAEPAGQPQAQPQGPMKVDLLPTQNEWTKVCGKDQAAGKELCYTTRDFTAQADRPPLLALAVYDVKGEDMRIVRLMMPPGFMLRPGFRFTIDKSAAQEGTFEICFPNGCFAEAHVKGAVIESMKKAITMNVAVRNDMNAEVNFAIPLAGFGKSFDGAPVDPKVIEEQQKKMVEELQKRAEEERKKLQASQPGAASAPATAVAPAAATPK